MALFLRFNTFFYIIFFGSPRCFFFGVTKHNIEVPSQTQSFAAPMADEIDHNLAQISVVKGPGEKFKKELLHKYHSLYPFFFNLFALEHDRAPSIIIFEYHVSQRIFVKSPNVSSSENWASFGIKYRTWS
ncbi:hypothetical protein CM15mP43_05110 [bacterium]|nr:MAG: hypothetical protein CM15mP43_05110 [bacterium]